jgi:branched-chain amino acid transport system ATP-binding protein
MLEVQGVATRYGSSQVLFGIDLRVGDREMVTLMGRNGMGKTTTVRSIMGLTPPFAGSVRFDGTEMTALPAHARARRGIGLVPEGRQVFARLDVEENLRATARPGPWTLARVLELFPRLGERRRNMGRQLSGGEQQMLAIGRALMTNPRLLIMDEATEGLAPLVREEIWRCLATLRREGLAILLIDKNVQRLLALADRHVIVEKGRCVWQGAGAELQARPELVERHLGV